MLHLTLLYYEKRTLLYSFLLLSWACNKPKITTNECDGNHLPNFDEVYEISQNSIFEKALQLNEDEKKYLEEHFTKCTRLLEDEVPTFEFRNDIKIIWYGNTHFRDKFEQAIGKKVFNQKIIYLPYYVIADQMKETANQVQELKMDSQIVHNTIIDYILLSELIPYTVKYYQLLSSYYSSQFINYDKNMLDRNLINLYRVYYINAGTIYNKKLNPLASNYSSSYAFHFISTYLSNFLHKDSNQILDKYINSYFFYEKNEKHTDSQDSHITRKLKLELIRDYANQLSKANQAKTDLGFIIKHFVNIEQICHLFNKEEDLIKLRELIKKNDLSSPEVKENLEYARNTIQEKLQTHAFDRDSFLLQLDKIHRPAKFNDAISVEINKYKDFWGIKTNLPLGHIILDCYELGSGYSPIMNIHYLTIIDPSHINFMTTFCHEMGHVIQSYYIEQQKIRDFNPKKHDNTTRCKELEADFFSAYYLAHPTGENSSTDQISEYSKFHLEYYHEGDDSHGSPLQRQRAFNFGANLAKMNYFKQNTAINIAHLHCLFKKYLKASDSFLNIENSEKELFTSPNSGIQDISKKEKLNLTFQKIKVKLSNVS